ncbi:HD domain-containing protein [Desulfovibrio sp. OttesenSCG-928-I05]|nr:HD domain-containing protein [Desulfovibrio sp. OttesenSCG-928-I05]
MSAARVFSGDTDAAPSAEQPWNDAHERVRELVRELARELGPHPERFFSYARSYDSGNAEEDRYLRLKEEHSLNVLFAAGRIAAEEPVFTPPALRRALLLAALYHDLARFPQYARFKTFSDPRSFNHGHMASREIGRLNLLADESVAVARMARAAVALHNRFSLPAGIPADLRRVTQALRDADKLDILRIMHDALRPGIPVDATILLHVADSSDFTPKILEAVRTRRMASYTDLKTNTDFRLLLCGWFYDLTYPASRRMAVASGVYTELTALLPDHPALNSFAKNFHADLERA